MSDKFTWGDGLGLTVVKASQDKPSKAYKEIIGRCDKDGNYIINGEPCSICRLIEGKEK